MPTSSTTDNGLTSLLNAIDNVGPLKGISQSLAISNQETPDEKYAGRIEGFANQMQQNSPLSALIKGAALGVASGKRSKAEEARDARLQQYQDQIEHQNAVAQQGEEYKQVLQKTAVADIAAKQVGRQLTQSIAGLELGDESGIRNVLAAKPEIGALLVHGQPEGTTIDGANVVNRNGAKMLIAYGRTPDGANFQGEPIPVSGILERYDPEGFKAQNDAILERAKTQSEIDKNNASAAKDARGPESKPISPSAIKIQNDNLAAIGSASGVNADLGKFITQIDDGKLDFGPVSNMADSVLNNTNSSTENSANKATFKANLERLRNESLRLNTGVQTDSDANRAWSELITNLNDKNIVKQRLQDIQRINERAVELRKLQTDTMRSEYNKEPLDYSQYQAQPSSVGATPPASTSLVSSPQAAQIKAQYQAGQITKEQAKAAIQALGAQ